MPRNTDGANYTEEARRRAVRRGAATKPTRSNGWALGESRTRTGGSVLALGFGDALDLLAQQGDVERLLEDVVEPVLAELLRGGLVLARQADDQCPAVGLVLAQVRHDLDALGPAQAQ